MSPDTAPSPHISVMLNEFLEFFSGNSLRTFFEGTVGAGGHARALLQAHPEIEHYIGCDQDPEALGIARSVLSPWKNKIELIQGNFSTLDIVLEERKINKVDGFFLISEFRLCN